MKTCPACHGDGGFDFSDVDAPLGRLARLIGVPFIPQGVVECEVCDGLGTISDRLAFEYECWAVHRVDQFLAAVEAGEVAA